MVKVKICGITNVEDVEAAAECGADLIGFVFVKRTPRYIEPEKVKDIINTLEEKGFSKVSKVGLFKDEDEKTVIETVLLCGLDRVQLHGDEDPEYCITVKRTLKEKYGHDVKIMKVFKVSDKILPHGKYVMKDYAGADEYVFDTFHPDISGGTGTGFDFAIIRDQKNKIDKPFFIAGGLTPGNVKRTVLEVNPYGVDVSSGVEKMPGKKDALLLKEFVTNAKSA